MISYSALLPNTESHNSVKVNGINQRAAQTLAEMVRPREIRARNKPTNGDHATHHAQKKERPVIHPLNRTVEGKTVERHAHKAIHAVAQLTFSTSALSRNEVSPINSTNRINPSASATLSSDNTRMPSTPEVTEIVAMITDKDVSAAFVASNQEYQTVRSSHS